MTPTIPPEDDDTHLTLSREDLYELAWSKPLRELAKDFGISDVALAKRCRRLGIPVPGRGYWARVDAGQRPYRPKLPSREPQSGDHSALIAGPSSRVSTPTEAAESGARLETEPTPGVTHGPRCAIQRRDCTTATVLQRKRDVSSVSYEEIHSTY